VERIECTKGTDILGFEIVMLIGALDFEHAKPYLKPEAVAEQWTPEYTTDDAVKKQIAEYMDFAVEKAVDHRGISAGRSVSHYRAWLWLIGDDELVAFCNDDNYPNYGAPILKRIAEKYGINIPENAVFDAMALGQRCALCDRGDESGCSE